jgi:uncharacterized protein YecE (DUF72 family)
MGIVSHGTLVEGWRQKITSIAQRADKTFAITNNHYEGQAAVNALELKNMLTRKAVKAPKPLVNHYEDRLKDIAEAI